MRRDSRQTERASVGAKNNLLVICLLVLPSFRQTDVSVAVANPLIVWVRVRVIKLPSCPIWSLWHEVTVVGVHAAALAVVAASIWTPAERYAMLRKETNEYRVSFI